MHGSGMGRGVLHRGLDWIQSVGMRRSWEALEAGARACEEIVEERAVAGGGTSRTSRHVTRLGERLIRLCVEPAGGTPCDSRTLPDATT